MPVEPAIQNSSVTEGFNPIVQLPPMLLGDPDGATRMSRRSPATTLTECVVSLAVVAAPVTVQARVCAEPFFITVNAYDLPTPGAARRVTLRFERVKL